MQRFQDRVWDGLRATVRYWRVLLPMYIVGLALGLIQTWPLLGAAARGALSNPFLQTLAGGGFDSGFDLFLSNPGTAGATAGFWALATVLFALVYGAAYNYFAGGILSAYAGRSNVSFWVACWQTFWTFTGLGLLLVTLALVLAVVAAVAGGAVGQRVALITVFILLQLANLVGEYARALAVARGQRNPFALIGQAVRFCVGHPGTLGLALIGVLLHLTLLLIYRVGASSIGGSPLLVAWQQLVVLAWVWVKLLRLSWAAAYVRGGQTEQIGGLGLSTVVQ